MKSSSNKLSCLSEVLTFLMLECDIDDGALSKETGIPVSTITRMRLNSDANPTASTLRPLAKFFSISISQLLGDEPLDQNRLPGMHNPSFFTESKLPIITWDLVIDWINNNSEKLSGKFFKWLSTEKEVGERCFALPILSDHFGLAFRKASIVMLDPHRTPIDGDLVLTKKLETNSLALKQLFIDDDDTFIKSLNPEIKNIKLLSKYEIIGVVFETRFSLVDEKITVNETKRSNIIQSVLSPSYKTK